MKKTLWHRWIHPVTGHFRRRRSLFLHELFPNIQNMQICDLGGSRHFWEKLDMGIPKQNISIYNISADETHAEKTGTEAGEIPVYLYDGKRIPVEDKHFDLLICNSVIEHVPPAERAALAGEMSRAAKKVFCQTPAYNFPVDPHFVMPFIHWLPKKAGFVLAKISPWRIMARPSKAVIEDYFWNTNLLKEKELKDLFPDGKIYYEKFLGLPKSYYLVV